MINSCILCLSQDSDIKLISISENILKNYSINDAIQENFQYFSLILTVASKSICTTCYEILKSFKKLQQKVNEIYGQLNQTIEVDKPDEQLQCEDEINDDEEIMEEEYLDECVENDELSKEETDIKVTEINETVKMNLDYEVQENTQNKEDFSELNQKSIQNDKTIQLSQNHQNSIEIIQEYSEISTNQYELQENHHKSSSNDQKIRDFIDIKCHICNINFDSFHEVYKHFKASHPSEKAYLVCCDRKFTQKSLLLEHFDYHDKSQIHKCIQCSKEFKTKAILNSHMRNFHTKTFSDQPMCIECGKIFTNKYILKTHMRKHQNDSSKSFECYICKKSAKNFQLLTDHFKYKHHPDKIKSSICHICSKNVTRLDIHLRQMHPMEPIERVKCEICGHWLKKSTLKGHMAMHNQIENFTCTICKKILKNKNSYFCHMKRVHTEGKFKCEYCEKSFHQEGRLRDHVACQHTGNYLHHCRVEGCEKMFRNAGRRRMHERRMHPDEYEKNFKPVYLRDHVDE